MTDTCYARPDGPILQLAILPVMKQVWRVDQNCASVKHRQDCKGTNTEDNTSLDAQTQSGEGKSNPYTHEQTEYRVRPGCHDLCHDLG